MTKEELQRLYGEAVLEVKIWNAKASEYERQLIELLKQKEPEK